VYRDRAPWWVSAASRNATFLPPSESNFRNPSFPIR
jgi:hypothetical protein